MIKRISFLLGFNGNLHQIFLSSHPFLWDIQALYETLHEFVQSMGYCANQKFYFTEFSYVSYEVLFVLSSYMVLFLFFMNLYAREAMKKSGTQERW